MYFFILSLVVFCILSCASAPQVTPHVIDTQLQECREYKVVNTDTLEVRKVKDWPIQHCEGFWAIPPEEAALLKAWYLKQKNGNQ
jgi:hypothetical protein